MDLYQKFRLQESLVQIPRGNILVAVSGGADSVCLLHAVKRLAKEKKWTPIVVHVQHHLRGKASLKDQAFVKALADKWGFKFHLSEIRPPKEKSTEEKSRMLRYHEFGEAAKQYDSKFILTAHNANDQAETFFLNLIRGSGSDGLCGMPVFRALSEITLDPTHAKLQVARPYLNFSRKEIESYLASQHLNHCHDSTNADLKYRRNWVRAKVIPLMEEVQPKLVERIAELSQILRDQKEYLETQVTSMEQNIIRWGGTPAGELLDLTRFFEYNQLLRQYFLHRLRPKSSFREIGEIIAFLNNKRKSAQTVPLPR